MKKIFMIKIISILLIAVMVLSGVTVFADEDETTGTAVEVSFFSEQFPNGDFELKVSDYLNTEELTKVDGGYKVVLPSGAYTFTATKEGYYGSTCAFTVNTDGTVKLTTNWNASTLEEYGIDGLLNSADAEFNIILDEFVPSENEGAWDGKTLDVTWFDGSREEGRTYDISTPAQLMGLAAVVNGIFNDEITTIIDNVEGTVKEYTVTEYDAMEGAKIKAECSSQNGSGGPNGQNLVTSDDYYYSAYGYDFDGQTVNIKADLNMGGYKDSEGNWTGARYMPIGGQYQMYYVRIGIADGYSHLGSSFNGTLDGQGHIVYNIYCDRYSVTNYGDSSTIGLVGRLGTHDNDYETWQENGDHGGNYPAYEPTVKNVAVDGYIYGRRSVGGIVGKTGKTTLSVLNDGSRGAVIENCVNFAEVHNTDAKGVGGIVGAAWNGGVVKNCANFGYVHSTYHDPTGGIVGYNENTIINCLNVGLVKNFNSDARYAEAIGSNNGGTYYLENNYWLTGSAAAGGYYRAPSAYADQIIEKTEDELKAAGFDRVISGSGRGWVFPEKTDAISDFLEEHGYSGYTVPGVFSIETATVTGIEKIADPANRYNTDSKEYEYIEGEHFDITGMVVRASWSDGSTDNLEDFVYSIDGEEHKITDPFTAGSHTVSFKYTVGELSLECSYTVEAAEICISKIQMYAQPSKRTYTEGEAFEPSGTKLKIVYNNGSSNIAVWTDGVFTDADNPEKTYDIAIKAYIDDDNTIEADLGSLPYEMNGRKITFELTEDEEVFTATSMVLTITPSDGEPEQDSEGVYLIATAKELDWFASQVNNGIETDARGKLLNDIKASSDYEPIGVLFNQFCGELDGDGHTITIEYSGTDSNRGIIGYADGALIQNLIAAGTVSCGSTSACLISTAKDTRIINCGNETDLTTETGSPVAGIVASASGNTLISGCFNKGDILRTSTGSNGITGGICGEITSAGVTIENCYNEGDITGRAAGNNGIGGIVGRINYLTDICNVFNTGAITNGAETGNLYDGAIAGYATPNTASTITNYYWLEETNAKTGYAIGGTAKISDGSKSDIQLKSRDFVTALNGEGSAFIENCGYPVLSWEEAVAHTPSVTAVKENETAATCIAEGSYDEVVYCSVCGGELSRETKTTSKLKKGWEKDSNGIWHYYENNVAATGWKKVDGVWYLFDENGNMLTGWQKVDGTWYYLKDSGAMATGWLKDGDTWYYMNESGAMATGWVKVGSTWYYMKESGAMAAGWVKVGSTWYYLKDSGAMATGWVKVGSTWYYMDESGAMVTGWLKIGSTWYYFQSSGTMVTGKVTIDGRVNVFSSSGAWQGYAS